MGTFDRWRTLLHGAQVSLEIFKLRPNYRALLIVVDGINAGPSNETSETMLQQAEAAVRAQLAHHPVTEPLTSQQQALTRRVDNGLPRVNRLTDIYNPISVAHHIPLGGEDLEKYSGPPRLIRAKGDEDFEATAGGKTVLEHPEVGEVVWLDDLGVTCRRWNWPQGSRTALTEETRSALFILDVLEPISEEALAKAADELADALQGLGQDVRVEQRLITSST
ncbi:hypothetical protein DV736_g6658, partial [Chaetothyriales sp. CBS 134916]